jgi:hypothetical protein
MKPQDHWLRQVACRNRKEQILQIIGLDNAPPAREKYEALEWNNDASPDGASIYEIDSSSLCKKVLHKH